MGLAVIGVSVAIHLMLNPFAEVWGVRGCCFFIGLGAAVAEVLLDNIYTPFLLHSTTAAV